MKTFDPTSFSPRAIRRLSSLEDHRTMLKEVLQTAKERVLIVSPFISKTALRNDDIAGKIRSAVARGVKVSIYIDNKLNRIRGELKRVANDGIAEMIEAGATVTVLDGIHNKTLIRDNDLITEGSFNWLSAVRTSGAIHQREERTIVILGDEAKGMIADEIMSFSSKKMLDLVDLINPSPEKAYHSGHLHSEKPNPLFYYTIYGILTVLLVYIILQLNTTVWRLDMDPVEFIFCFVLVIFLLGLVQWKKSGEKKIFRFTETPKAIRNDTTFLGLVGDRTSAANVNNQAHETDTNTLF